MQHPVLKIQKNAHCASFKSETPTHLAICLSGLSDMESSLHLWLKPKAIEFNFSTSQENKPTDCRTFFCAAALALPCASTAAITHGDQPDARHAVDPATSDTAEAPKKLVTPDKSGSCHTETMDDYLLKGYAPSGAFKRLLASRPGTLRFGRLWNACRLIRHEGRTAQVSMAATGRRALR